MVYTCESCAYSAHVAGGLSSKFKGDAVTHVCRDCRELKDLLVRRYERNAQPVGQGPTLLTPVASEPIHPRCDQDRNHRIERWPQNQGHLCPRCGALMEGAEDG